MTEELVDESSGLSKYFRVYTVSDGSFCQDTASTLVIPNIIVEINVSEKLSSDCLVNVIGFASNSILFANNNVSDNHIFILSFQLARDGWLAWCLHIKHQRSE